MTESDDQCWIGLNDLESEAYYNPNLFKWEDKSLSVYRHFQNGVIKESFYDCVVLSRENRSWTDTDCQSLYRCFVCRRSGN